MSADILCKKIELLEVLAEGCLKHPAYRASLATMVIAANNCFIVTAQAVWMRCV